jgi:hypothetical protein
MMPNYAFLFMETATLRAEGNHLKKIKEAVKSGDMQTAQKLARQHDLAWDNADREFQDLNQPHRNNDFCDDE